MSDLIEASLVKQEVLDITGHNIVSLYPLYDAEKIYTVEPLGVIPTGESVARVGNHLYRSTAENNKGNLPTDPETVEWVYYQVANIYAALDFDKETTTEWEGDGVMEFRKGISNVLAVGAVLAGLVQVETLEAKTGVIEGLNLGYVVGDSYYLQTGSWVVDGKYSEHPVLLDLRNAPLISGKDNYLYPKPTPTDGALLGASDLQTYDGYLWVLGKDAAALSVYLPNTTELKHVKSFFHPYLEDAESFDIINGMVYVITEAGYLVSIDATDLNDIQVRSRMSFGAAAGSIKRHLIATEDIVFISMPEIDSIKPISVEDPYSMWIVSTYTDPNINGVGSLAVEGDVLYAVSRYAETLTSFNASDPYLLVERHSLNHSNFDGAYEIKLQNSVAYTSGTGGRFAATDISDPDVLVAKDFYGYAGGEIADMAIDSTEAYIIGLDGGVLCINITNLDDLLLLGSWFNGGGGRGVLSIINSSLFVNRSAGQIDVADISVSGTITKISSFPDVAVSVLAVSSGYPQPTTPEGDLVVWMVEVDSGGDITSSTDLRSFTTLSPKNTQRKSFYNGKEGACLFDLPDGNESDTIRVTFASANGQCTKCGRFVAGKKVPIGRTLEGIDLTTKPYSTTYDRSADFETIVDKPNAALVNRELNEARGAECLFITDPNGDDHQHVLVVGTVEDVSYEATNSPIQQIDVSVSGDPLVDERPQGLETVPFFVLGIKPFQIDKGAGKAYIERDDDVTYVDPDYLSLKIALAGEVVNEALGMRSSPNTENEQDYSRDFLNATWLKANATIAKSVVKIGSDNSSYMTEVTGVDTSVYAIVYDSYVRADGEYISASWEVAPLTPGLEIEFTILNAQGGPSLERYDVDSASWMYTQGVKTLHRQIESLANGVSRVTTIGQFDETQTSNDQYRLVIRKAGDAVFDGTEKLYIDRAQLTNKAYPVPYIDSVSSAASTAGDVISHDSSEINIPNLEEDWTMKWVGTLYFDPLQTAQQVVQNYLDADNGLSLYIHYGNLNFFINSSGEIKYSQAGAVVSGQSIEVEIKCLDGVVTTSVDGVLKDSDDFSSVLDASLSDLTYIGSNNGSPNANLLTYTETFEWYEGAE